MSSGPEWLNIFEFRYWLDDKPDVGRAGSASACPIARYVKEVFPDAKKVSVGSGGVTVDGLSYTAPWVNRFVKGVDSGKGTVTATRAKQILDGI